jgi:hypothetical protein
MIPALDANRPLKAARRIVSIRGSPQRRKRCLAGPQKYDETDDRNFVLQTHDRPSFAGP